MPFSFRSFISPSLVHVVALLCACSAVWGSPSSAQADQILVVSGEKVPEKLSEAVSDALGDVGSVMDPASYSGNLRARHQEPDSEEALTKLAPQTGAALIVVLQHARGKVKVELRNGRNGSVLEHTSVPARGKRPKLSKPARKKLLTLAKRALSKVGPAPSTSSKRASSVEESSQDDFAEEPAPQPSRAASTPAKRPSQPARPVARRDEEEQDEDQASDDDESQGSAELAGDDESPQEKPEASGEHGTTFRLHAGLGLGSRAILVPLARGHMGANKIDTSFVPALDIGAALELPLGPKWVLRFGADYRTIFGLNAGYLTALGTMGTSSLSSHSLIVGASVGHLSDGRDSFGVHVLLGWAYRSLSPAQPSLPSASIQGLVLRPEVEIPIRSLKLTLRLAPELILILAPDATLPGNDSGLKKAVGYALGAEASIDLHISQTIGLSLQFRESRGSTPSGWGSSAIENERYLALRLLLQF